MIRHYLSKITGDGSDEDSFRAIAMDYGLKVYGSIPVNLRTGMPTQDWVLVTVFGEDQSVLESVAGINPLPDVPTDSLLAEMSEENLVMMHAAMAAHNLNPAMTNLAVTYSDVLARLSGSNTIAPGAGAELIL